jgi:hypothetical protein
MQFQKHVPSTFFYITIRNWGSYPFIFSHTKLQNQIQNQQTLYSTQITNSLVTLNFIIYPISLSPNARPSPRSNVLLLPCTRFSHLAWDSLGKMWENTTNTPPHHHNHQHPTPLLSNSNSLHTLQSSAKEKWVHIFGNHPYSMHLLILHIFDLLVSRVFGHSQIFLFQCIRPTTPLIPLYPFNLDYFVNSFLLEISHLVTPRHQLSTPSSLIQFIEPL